ncbi:MAG: hypothetical protein PUI46_10325 [Lachnospiraceae bacterium]|nr:hypothetical protein [Lachnospiraceae bacterium]MDY5701528.1 hypothetical protein [Lachnospiraceae bacterium]
MKSLAICIPTYNRSDVLKDSFAYELDACHDLGIDIYLYDSSDDGRTKELVHTLNEYENLYHIEIDSSVSLDEKVVMIFQSYGRQKKHDYLWLVGDSVSFGRELLERICKMVLLEPTMIFINNEDLQNLGDKEYSSVEEIFRELFWKSSLWGSIIVQESLYDDVDWETYIQKFVGTDQISVGLHWYRLASVQNFKAFLLSVRKGIDMRKSTLKKIAWWKGKECGSETVYRVWARGLVQTVYQLPFSEADIEAALETQRRYAKTFHWLGLCRSRKDGVYNLDIYRKYGKEIKIISRYPDILLHTIAITPIIPMKIIVRLADMIRYYQKE